MKPTFGLPLKLVYLSNAWEVREANGSLLFHIPAGREDKEAEANAQFIVTACNSHYELLEACKALHKRFITEGVDLPDDDEFLALERASMAAIAKAEGLPEKNPPAVDIGRSQCLERIAETADRLEDWLGRNTGDNDDWPISIKADEDGVRKLTSLLMDLKDALMPYRKNK